jgi:preprotein translocase subunit SecB
MNLTIEYIGPQKVIFEKNLDFDINHPVSIRCNINTDGNYQRQENRLYVTLTISSVQEGQDSYPFTFSTQYDGRFLLSEPVDQEKASDLIRINCAAIMFPYVREFIASLTMRAGFPPLHVPPVNFVSLARKTA